MHIGIIGAGMIGATTARLFALSNTRGPASLAPLVADLGPNVRAATIEEAASFGAVVQKAGRRSLFIDAGGTMIT